MTRDSVTSGATQRTTPVIRVTESFDEIVDNYDVNATNTDSAADQGIDLVGCYKIMSGCVTLGPFDFFDLRVANSGVATGVRAAPGGTC